MINNLGLLSGHVPLPRIFNQWRPILRHLSLIKKRKEKKEKKKIFNNHIMITDDVLVPTQRHCGELLTFANTNKDHPRFSVPHDDFSFTFSACDLGRKPTPITVTFYRHYCR